MFTETVMALVILVMTWINCPNPFIICNNKHFKLIKSFDGSDNIEGLKHSDYECAGCGYRFNVWNEPTEKIKKVFGEFYHLYA